MYIYVELQLLLVEFCFFFLIFFLPSTILKGIEKKEPSQGVRNKLYYYKNDYPFLE